MYFVDTEWLWDQEGKKLPSTEVLKIVTKKLLRYKIQKSYGKGLNMLNNKDAYLLVEKLSSHHLKFQYNFK